MVRRIKTRKIATVLAVFVVVYALYRIKLHETLHASELLTEERDSENADSRDYFVQKRFLYLIQTEICLPLYFNQADVLGNAAKCRCDVIVLSFKGHCYVNASGNTSHIQYIYGPNTTWASGRNTLYRYTLQRNVNYLYYIFADDDVRLSYNIYANTSVTQEPELRTFEKFLLEVAPAVGCVNYPTHHPAVIMKTIRKHCRNKPDLSLIPMIHFDPILNAFHRDAIKHLLPYVEDYDSECWWHSHRFVSIAIEFKFRGQALMFPGITAFNTLHRQYPVNNTNEVRVFHTALDREIAKLPESYRSHFAVKLYKQDPLQYEYGYGQTTCMEFHPNQSIQPYLHYRLFPLAGYQWYNNMFDLDVVENEIAKLFQDPSTVFG